MCEEGTTMSVLMTFRSSGDPAKLEELAGRDPGAMRAIADAAREQGCLSHRFYGSDQGEIMVLDEWESPEAFERFFASQSAAIRPMMDEVGATGQPHVSFWRKLDTHDEF
jgi:quinol monooxygenase YgiN